MLSVDRVYIFPFTPGAKHVGPLYVPRPLRTDLDRLFSVLTPVHPEDEAVDNLFDDEVDKNARKRGFEVLAQKAGEHTVAAERAIMMASGGGGGGVKTAATKKSKKCNDVVDEYEAYCMREGIAGHIGLLPEPWRDSFPADPPDSLDPDVRQFLTHFYNWIEKRGSV